MADANRITESHSVGAIKYRSEAPLRVRQSKAHREMVSGLLPLWPKATPAAQRAIGKLGACGTWNGVSYTRAGFPARYWCRLHVCRHCGDRWKKKTATALAKDVRALADPHFSNVRRITLNLALVFDAKLALEVEAQREKFTKLFERKLGEFALVGGFDFALKTGGLVMIHVHGVLVGPPDRMSGAEHILRAMCSGVRSYSSDELRDRLDNDMDGPTTWLSYALDSAITAPKHNRKPNWEHHSLAYAEEKLRWIELHAGLRNQKGNLIRQTIRFGVRRMLNSKEGKREAQSSQDGRAISSVFYDGLLDRLWRCDEKVRAWSCTGESWGEMYEHLFEGPWNRRLSDSLRCCGMSIKDPADALRDPADVKHAMPWKTPARGPPSFQPEVAVTWSCPGGAGSGSHTPGLDVAPGGYGSAEARPAENVGGFPTPSSISRRIL